MMSDPCPGCEQAGQPELCAHTAEDWALAIELTRAFRREEPLTPARIWSFIEDAESLRPLCPAPPWTVRRLDLMGHLDGGCVINEDLVCAVALLPDGLVLLTPLVRIDPAAQRAQIAGEIADRIRVTRFDGVIGRRWPDAFYAGVQAAEAVARQYGRPPATD